MRILLLLLLCFILLRANAQSAENYAVGTLGVSAYRGSLSLSYVRQWGLCKKKKFAIGFGGRFTAFAGANLYYITAPGKLTSGSSGPLIIFKENITANIDSLLIKSPQVNSLNLMLNLDYGIAEKITIGFNIDLIGFSFGKKQRGNYINGFQGKNTEASPTKFNILLISDNDRGSLNSELYSRYKLSENWSLKIAAQFLFTEYTTDDEVQEFPEKNDRFRNKSLLAAVGITRKL